jgi:hypothetical protein
MNLETKIYRALLKLYPREFRQEYGQEMIRVFQESLRSEGSSFGFWLRTFWDVLSSVFKVQLDTTGGGFMRTGLVKFGAVCGVALGFYYAWIGMTSPLFTTPSWIESIIWNACFNVLLLGFALLRNTRPHALEIAGYAALVTSQAINILPVESLGMVGLWFSLAGLFTLAFGSESTGTKYLLKPKYCWHLQHGWSCLSFCFRYFICASHLSAKIFKVCIRSSLLCFRLGWVGSSSRSVGPFGLLQAKILIVHLEHNPRELHDIRTFLQSLVEPLSSRFS